MKKIAIGNLKMNILSFSEREKYFSVFKKEFTNLNLKMKNVEVVLCPPFLHLEAFGKWKNKKISLGAQNVFWENKGSYTGEVSSLMVRNFGCEYVILGHSERRRYFLEKNEEINLKIISALRNSLRPIVCVGEKLEEKINSGLVIAQQLEGCLRDVSRGKIENVIICYEPVWAISSNKPDSLPTSNDMMSAKLVIKKFLVNKYGLKTSEKVRIIYGGSVSSGNVREVCLEPKMDGVLVGKESLSPYEFIKIIKILAD